MDEKLQVALAEFINKTLQAAETGVEFLGDEIPDVIYQLLLWKGIYNFVLFILALIIFFIIYKFVKFQYKWWNEEIENGNGYTMKRINTDGGIISIANILLIIPVAIALSWINLIWLQVLIAPKVYLLEYAIKLLGGE